jgi:Cof subfamily protein (haloacid dehalogenase superfamily)
VNGTDTDKNQGYKLVVFDLDGTLVDDKLLIDNQDLESIKEARHRGIEITLATGRTLHSALPYIEQLQVNLPVILCNGAAIVDPATEKILYQQKLTLEAALLILQRTRKAYLDCLLYTDPISSCPCVSQLTSVLRDFILLEGLRCAEINNLEEVVRSEQPIKIQVVGDEKTLLAVQRFLCTKNPEISVLMTQNDYLEAMPSGVSKGAALARLSALIDIPLFRIAAFGDSVNDEQLLAIAGLGVAMSGAPERLRKVANTTAPSVAAGLKELLS